MAFRPPYPPIQRPFRPRNWPFPPLDWPKGGFLSIGMPFFWPIDLGKWLFGNRINQKERNYHFLDWDWAFVLPGTASKTRFSLLVQTKNRLYGVFRGFSIPIFAVYSPNNALYLPNIQLESSKSHFFGLDCSIKQPKIDRVGDFNF